MKTATTLKVYFDASKKNYQVVNPSDAFFKEGAPWNKLAQAIYPGYHSFDVL